MAEKTIKERIAAQREENYVKFNNAEQLHDYLQELSSGDANVEAELLSLAVEPSTLQMAFHVAAPTNVKLPDQAKPKKKKAKPTDSNGSPAQNELSPEQAAGVEQ